MYPRGLIRVVCGYPKGLFRTGATTSRCLVLCTQSLLRTSQSVRVKSSDDNPGDACPSRYLVLTPVLGLVPGIVMKERKSLEVLSRVAPPFPTVVGGMELHAFAWKQRVSSLPHPPVCASGSSQTPSSAHKARGASAHKRTQPGPVTPTVSNPRAESGLGMAKPGFGSRPHCRWIWCGRGNSRE